MASKGKTRAPRAPKDPDAEPRERKPREVNPHRSAALAYARALAERDKLAERVALRVQELHDANVNLATCDQTIEKYIASMPKPAAAPRVVQA